MFQRRSILTVLPMLAVLLGARLPAAEPAWESPPRSALVERLLGDLDDGTLDEFPLLEAALIVSGVDGEGTLAEYRAHFSRVCENLHPGEQATPRQRAETAFRVLHKWILTGSYQADCTEVNRTFDEGLFNCVTATVLYHCLCAKVGLYPQAMATDEHVFSRFAEGRESDVETTCPQWFSRSASERALFQSTRAPASGRPRKINNVQLLGKVFYNRGVAQLEARRFLEAVDALRISVRLDAEDRAARENLLAALNNWSLAESDSGNYQQAVRLLAYGEGIQQDYGPFRANDLHIHQKWALSLCRQGDHREALELLERGHQLRPHAELYDLGRFAVCSLWAESLLDGGQLDQAWEVFTEARRRYPRRAEVLRYEEAAIHRSIETLLLQGRRREALSLSVRGLEWQPDSERLQSQHDELTQSGS